jgi:thioredoxin 1
MIIDVNSIEEFVNLIDSTEKVVVMFWATYVGPCNMIMPLYQKYAKDYTSDSFVFVRVDADQVPALGIRTLPTFRSFKNGEQQNQVIGTNKYNLDHLITELT